MLSGCAGIVKPKIPVSTGTPWPTDGWQAARPETQGMDAQRLEQMQARIKSEQIPLHSLLIIRHGVIVSENYYSGYQKDTQHELYSVTKSFISTLVGIAFDQGKLTALDQKALELLGETSSTYADAQKQAITLENLLTMTTGLGWTEGDVTYRQMYMSPNWVNMVLSLPMTAEPGKTFNYCSGCSHILSAILQRQTGGTEAFAMKNLFGPLGITNYRWEKDNQAIPIGGWGLQLTSRDMAKLGYLYLHQGQWEGRQVVSSAWVKTATQKHVPTDGNLGYGYQWWTYPSGNAYTALGRGGQTVFVAPDQDLIVVTTADLPAGHDPIFDLIDNYILPAAK